MGTLAGLRRQGSSYLAVSSEALGEDQRDDEEDGRQDCQDQLDIGHAFNVELIRRRTKRPDAVLTTTCWNPAGS
jgi:hypothetical protein